MKKYAVVLSALILALFAVVSVSAIELDVSEVADAALSAENTSELLYYQNFDNLETGVVTNIPSMFGLTSVFKDLGTIAGGASIPTGATFEICEEADGNKYLKVTGKTYRTFGVHFLDADGSEESHYAIMDFNYKYPQSGKNVTVMRFALESSTKYYGNFAEDTVFTNNTSTVWSNVAARSTTNAVDSIVKSPCLGLGFTQTSLTEPVYEIHIDDFAVYGFALDRNTSHTSDVRKTISFANRIGVTATSLPSAVTGAAWYNLYDGQHYTNPTLNLNSYSATATGYVFKGWSMTDGGLKIKDIDYSSFKVIGDITLYPIWEKIVSVSDAKFEDFEDFEIGQTLTSADLDFLNLNQFNAAGFTATIIEDEITGSKALKLYSSARYSGFNIKNRVNSNYTGNEYWAFNYRFPTSDAGSALTLYAGTDHTGSNQKQTITSRNVAWSRLIQGLNPTAVTTGCFFTETTGNYEIIIDDVYYWFVPTDYTSEEKAVEITFANSSTGVIPEPVTLPETKKASMWEVVGGSNTGVNLESKVPTDYSGVYSFKGWSRNDGGAVLKPFEILSFIATEDVTLYAVWEYVTPESLDEYSIRTGNNAGVRFSSSVTASQRNAATEYGYIVARNDVLESLGFTADDLNFNLTHESVDAPLGKLYLKGVAYENLDGGDPETDIVFGDTDEGATIFTAVCTGIDVTSKAALTTELVVRPYILVNGVYCYGAPMVKSYYDIALLIKNGDTYESLNDVQKEFIDGVVAVCSE